MSDDIALVIGLVLTAIALKAGFGYFIYTRMRAERVKDPRK